MRVDKLNDIERDFGEQPIVEYYCPAVKKIPLNKRRILH